MIFDNHEWDWIDELSESRFVAWVIIVLLAIATLSAGVAIAEPQSQDTHIGMGLFCDSPDQVRLVAKHMNSGSDVVAAVRLANESGASCAVGIPVIFRHSGIRHGHVSVKGKVSEIREIIVVGYLSASGVPVDLPPEKQFAIFGSSSGARGRDT